MEKRQLGKTTLEMAPVIFGAWAIGGWMWGGSDVQETIAAIQASLDQGINTIDTAAIYGMGTSEELVAKAIEGRREQVLIATKCGMRWDSKEGTDPWLSKDPQGKDVVIRKNSKPASIIQECEQSLKRLKTDVIDLYQIHWADTSTPIEDSWGTMVQLKQQGKVRAIGVSNYNLEQLKRAHAVHPVDSLQPSYSLLQRDIEQEILPFCRANGISILAYSPLERGLLTGKVGLDRQFAQGDHRASSRTFAPENRKRVLEALEKIKPIAERHRATLSQVVIKCTINQPGITAALVGARNAAQAKENALAASLPLTAEEQEFIAQVLHPGLLEL